MIVVQLAVLLLYIAVGVAGYYIHRLMKYSREKEKMLANLGIQVSQNKASIEVRKAETKKDRELLEMLCTKTDGLEKKLEEMDVALSEQDARKLEEELSKKWEDAIQRISDFDPFGGEAK